MKEAINRLGFGAWQLGNTEDWGAMDEETAMNLVREAYQQGINFFDTAPNYAGGRSETFLGNAVHGFREHIYINSKYGHDAEGHSGFSVEGIERSIRGSLSRLKTNYLDSVLLHNPPMDILLGKTSHFKELKRLKTMGLIRAYGVSIDTQEEVEAVLKHTDITVIELLYNVFFQSCRSLLSDIHKRGITLIIKVPLDSGWLSGKYNEQSTFQGIRERWSQDVILRRGQLVHDLVAITGDASLTKYAVGFLWSYPEITTVIPGIKNLDQLNHLVEARDFPFSKKMKKRFEELYDQKIAKDPLPW